MKFLIDLKEEKFNKIKENLDDSDNIFLDIQDLEISKKFLDNLGSRKNITDKELLEKFILEVKKQKNILLYFKGFFYNFTEYKEIKTQQLNDIENYKTKSKEISSESFFQLSTNVDSQNILYFQENKEKKGFI